MTKASRRQRRNRIARLCRPSDRSPLEKNWGAPRIHRTRNENTGDVITRAAAIVPDSLNSDDRSVRCCLTTEDPVRVWDYHTGRIVLETLVVSGAETEDQTPLLRDHRQYSVTAILGSVTEHAAERDELVGLLTFGEDLDEESEAIWRRVAQGHLRRVSVGYDYTRNDYTTIPAGETQKIGGRTFTAPKDFDLRVVTRWRLREVSVVVIPADARAQMRAGETNPDERGTPSANPRSSQLTNPPTAPTVPPDLERPDQVNELLRFLRSHGLPADQNPADNAACFAWARANLAAEHNQALHDLCRQHSIDGFNAGEFPIPQRSAPTNPLVPASQTETELRAAGITAERERQAAIRELSTLHPNVSAETVQRCLNEGLSIDQTQAAFLESLRSGAAPPVGPVPSGAPAGHVRGDLTLQSLQAGLLARFGITPDSPCLRAEQAENVVERRGMQLGWLRGAARTGPTRDAVEQAYDVASQRRLPSGSLMRFCESLIELSGERAPWNEDEILERAFSNGNFQALFGSVVHLMMLQGYTETPSTYQEFCRIKDVADFRPNKEGIQNGVGRLRKQGMNGGPAALLNIEDPTVSQVAAERYAGVLKVSDQVIINDSFDVVDQLPREVGVSARQIPGDLAYALVLGNPTLSDSAAFYVNGTNFITSGSLDEAGLSAATALMKNKKIGNKRIVVSESVLLHGTTQSTIAKKIINNTTTTNGEENVLQNSYRRVEDNAIDLGVNDPANNDAAIAGKPNSYYLFGEPKRSLVMAFRRGTNRGPVTRSGQLPVGEFGLAWDVLIDVGVAVTSRFSTVRVDIS